jgi:hypothetical protein
MRGRVTNGVCSIEHGNLLDEPTAAVMAERDAFLMPTLVTYDAMERRGAELRPEPKCACQRDSGVTSPNQLRSGSPLQDRI